MHLPRCLVVSLFALVFSAVAAEPLPYAKAVAERFPAPAVSYDTPGLQPGRTDFTRNDELNAALRALAVAGAARLIELTHTGIGSPVLGLHYSRGAGRPAVLLLGQQHGNEPAGAEAILVIARRLADADDSLAKVLDKIDLWLLPRINPDGAVQGRRRNGDGLDINRDHVLLQTAEARALARLATEISPVLVIDAHEYQATPRHMGRFGGIKRHDLLLQFATTANLAPALTEAAEQWFRQPLLQAMERAGLSTDWYHTNPTAGHGLQLSMGSLGPNLARNASGLRHAVSILLESRGFDLGRLHLQRRVHTHVVAVQSLLHSAAEHADTLRRLQADVAVGVAGLACEGEVVLDAAPTMGPRELLLLDPVTGADRPTMVQWGSALTLRAVASRTRPCGYWLAAAETKAVERLRALGLTLAPITQPQPLPVQRYRELERGEGVADDDGDRPDRALRVSVALTSGTLVAPAGSWYLPLDQPLANLAIVALEPDTPHSFFAHRLLESLDGVARVVRAPTAPAAER